MSFASDLFRKLFSSPRGNNPAPSTPSKRSKRRKRNRSNIDQTPGTNTNEPGDHSDEEMSETSEENDSDMASHIDIRSPALAMEMSIQEQLEDELSEQVMEREERHRSFSPSPSPQLKGKQMRAGEGSFRRQPLGDLDVEDLASTEATTSNNTEERPYNEGDQLSERAWRELSSDEAWKLSSNRRASDLVCEAQLSKGDARLMIYRSICEPEYALRDIEFRDGLWQIMDKIEELSKAHFAFTIPEDEHHTVLASMFGSMSRQTVKVIGCVASGGPDGEKGWHALFYDKERRQALVCAIIGNVLSEQVFQHIFFGGEPEHIEAVARLQQEHQDEDGFTRTERYAHTIQSMICKPKETPELPPNFANHTNYIVTAILTHLRPICSLDTTKGTLQPLIQSLYTIVAQSGMLSLLMRLDEHAAYTFMPVFKEVYFDTTRMECTNSASLKTTASQGDKVTQIVIMPGVTAFRRGGWETSGSSLADVAFEDKCKDKGIRERIITHGWVFCRRGKPRTVGRGAEEKFVEFFPGVQGVRNPKGDGIDVKVDRKGKGRA